MSNVTTSAGTTGDTPDSPIPARMAAGLTGVAGGRAAYSAMTARMPFRLLLQSVVMRLGSSTETAGMPTESSQLVASPLTTVPGRSPKFSTR